MIVVHVTHEAVEKIGGIGTVINGLATAEEYSKVVSRTVLLGPVLTTDRAAEHRLGAGGEVIYSTLDDLRPSPWREKFLPIERMYDVGVIYGTRDLDDVYTDRSIRAEVILIDVFHTNQTRLNLFKGELYTKFSVECDRFEHIWEFEEYIRLAEPGCDALRAIGCDGDQRVVMLAHEYMGMATALKAVLNGEPNTRTVFYAHEVASVRPIVEKAPGHDTMFYNMLKQASAEGKVLEEVFPAVGSNFKHQLVKAARYCDAVFAVGGFVEQELRFIDPHFRTMEIDTVYNGIPSTPLSAEQKRYSGGMLRTYGENLLKHRPTWVFSHVARPVLSKGIWRELRVLHEMEPMLAERGETAVLFMLGTLGGQRRERDIRHMEKLYGWPVEHEVGYPDLCCGEEVVGEMFDVFNRKHQTIRVVFVNQWDWNRRVCGQRMPAGMTLGDLRRGTDVEFGLSVYEPFGISQFEPLCFGALCVVSNVCGCMGFARHGADGHDLPENIIEGDFVKVGEPFSQERLIDITLSLRDEIESSEGARLAELIVERLPRDDATTGRRITDGYEAARKMSWEHVVREYFLPSLIRLESDGQ